ncbi:MAG TPA: pilus assembly protein PilB, partial [Chthoniobacteraceae bacterium]
MNVKQVLDLFLELALIDTTQRDEIADQVDQSGKSLVQVLMDYGICTEEEFYQHIAVALGTEYVDLTGFEPDPEVLRLVPAGHAILHRAIPLGNADGAIQLALSDPFNMQTVE